MNNKINVKQKSWYFFRLQELVFDDENLKPKEKLVYAVISKYADINNGKAFPSISTIAKKASYSSRTTVINAIKKLVQAGYIKKHKRKDNKNRNKSNLYEIKDLSYINNHLEYGKKNNKKFYKQLKKRLKIHPIPTQQEVMHLYSNMKNEDKLDQEMKDLYNKGYR